MLAGKENITDGRSHSRASNKSFTDKEETPITTAYVSSSALEIAAFGDCR